MTEMDTKFLEVLYSLPSDKAANSIYIANQLKIPRTQGQARINLARLARLKKLGYAISIKNPYRDSKHWKITKEGRDFIEANKREENGREENAIKAIDKKGGKEND